jgi:hypothetical protein
MNETSLEKSLDQILYVFPPPPKKMELVRGFKVFYNRRYFLNFRRYLKN